MSAKCFLTSYRQVPSLAIGNAVRASPLDPAADSTGAFRGLSNARGLHVISRADISQRLQKLALVFRRSVPHAPLRVSDHSPSHLCVPSGKLAEVCGGAVR